MIHTDGRPTYAMRESDDPNECPCTTGHNSFDGKTLAELGNEQASDDDDGHLEVDDYYRRHPEQDA